MESVQLICVDDAGNFIVTDDAYEFFSKLKTPTRVVSIIGRYRSGKSSLLNKLIGQSVFKTSPTVQASTKGIVGYMISDDLLVLDTEGLGSVQVNKNYDACIFALAMTISSGCIFNTMSTITSQDIQDIHLASKVGSLLTKHTKMNMNMPELLWVLRDFSLELKDDQGRVMCPDDYLEQCLTTSTDTNVVGEIKSLFPVRSLCVVTNPNSDHITFDHDVEYIKKCTHSFPFKYRLGKSLTGVEMHRFLRSLCVAINGNNIVPAIDSMWESIMKQTHTCALATALDVFRRESDIPTAIAESIKSYKEQMLGEEMTTDVMYSVIMYLFENDDKTIHTNQLLDNIRLDYNELQERLRTNESELQETLESKNAIKRELESVMTEVLSQKDSIIDLEKTIHEHITTISYLENETQQTNNNIKTKCISMTKDILTLKQENKLVTNKNTELTTRICELEVQYEEYMKEKTHMKSKQGTTQNQLEEYRKQVGDSNIEVAVLKTRYDDAVKRFTEKNKTIEVNQIQLIQATTENEYLKKRTREQRDCIDGLQQQLSHIKRHNHTLQLMTSVV